MGLNVNGRSVAAMRKSGADAMEARLNGTVVWSASSPDPWPTKPYLTLANGSRVRLLECRYEPPSGGADSGGTLIAPAGAECSAFYPDMNSAGVSLRYAFRNGCVLEYEQDAEFRLLDPDGNVLPPRQGLRDLPNTYGVTLFFAEIDGLLCMGIWYATRSYLEVESRASGGVPGIARTYVTHRRAGVTAESRDRYHATALALLRNGGNE